MREGATVKLPVEELTVPEINAAKRALTQSPARSRASEAHKALHKAMTSSTKLAGVRVQERDGSATFGHVPMSAIREFGRALTKVELKAAKKAPEKKRPEKKRPENKPARSPKTP